MSLAGCAHCPPNTLVPVPEYVKVPDSLLASYPCGAEPKTNGELLEAYAACLLAVQKHEADKASIRRLGN